MRGAIQMMSTLMMSTDNWTVWVGGGEYNSHYLTFNQAYDLAQHLKWDLDYDDVVLECVDEY